MAAIERVYELLHRLAEEAGSGEPHAFAHQLQIIMRGSIVAAVDEGLALARQLLEQLDPPETS